MLNLNLILTLKLPRLENATKKSFESHFLHDTKS